MSFDKGHPQYEGSRWVGLGLPGSSEHSESGPGNILYKLAMFGVVSYT